MKIYHIQTISLMLWILAAIFFTISVVLFFVFRIRKAWKIVFQTNFNVQDLKRKSLGNELNNSSSLKKSKKLYSRNLGQNAGEKISVNSGETVALEGNETLVLSNYDFMEETTNENQGTMILEREEYEIVVDIMLIHTSEII